MAMHSEKHENDIITGAPTGQESRISLKDLDKVLKALDTQIKARYRTSWSTNHDDAEQLTLMRLHRQIIGGQLKGRGLQELTIIALGHFRRDLKQVRHRATACGSTLRCGEHQKGPLSEAAERALRRELWIPTGMPLTGEWLLDEVERMKHCEKLSLEAKATNQDGEEIESLLVVEASVIAAASTDADAGIEWLQELLEELPSGSRMRALVVAFVVSWREGDGCKNWTAAANRLGFTRREAEREKRKLADIIASNPLASGALARVKKNAGRGAKLLR